MLRSLMMDNGGHNKRKFLRTMNYEGWKRRNEGKIEQNGHLGHKEAKVLKRAAESRSREISNFFCTPWLKFLCVVY
jgi:hypothetical protein